MIFSGETLKKETKQKQNLPLIFFFEYKANNFQLKILNLSIFQYFQGIMKDKWMNMGYEEEELKPFIEPIADLSDEKRIDTLVNLTLV